MIESIPDDWDFIPLKSIAKDYKGSIVDGPFGSNLKTSDYVLSGVPVLQGKNVTNDKFVWSDVRYITLEKAKELSRSSVRIGDILIVKIGSVGYSAIVNDLKGFDYAIIPANLMKIDINHTKAHTNYVHQYMISPEGKQRIIAEAYSTAQPALSLGTMKKFKLPIPPLPEQKKIASILSSVDEVIENTQKQINKLQDLKKATMNELLTKGIGHAEFKDSKLGRIPKSWEINELNDCLEIMTDYVANGSFQSLRENVNVRDKVDYALYVRLFDIRKGIIHQSQKYVDKNSYNFLKKSSLHGDEILIANIGAYVGQVHLMPKLNVPATLAPNMILLRVLKKYHYKFLYYFLSSSLGQKIINLSVAGSGQEKLNKTDLKKIKIFLPPMEEQVKISEIISKIERKIILVNKMHSKYILIKKSLMQDLLTGKVRVSVN